MDGLIEVISFLRKRFFFVDGLVVLLFITGMLYKQLADMVGYHILQLMSLLGWSSVDKLAHLFFILGLTASLGIVFIFWYRFRSVPIFSKDELGILFAPDFDEEAERDVERLFVQLKQEIRSHEVENRFSLKSEPAGCP